MSSPPPKNAGNGGSRAQALKSSGKAEQARPTAHEPTDSPCASCRAARRALKAPLPEDEPRYVHAGMGFAVTQYGIGKRRMALKLPDFAHGDVTTGAPLQNGGAASKLPLAATNEAATPLKITSPDPDAGQPGPFTATLTGGGNALKIEPTVHGYQLDGKSSPALNQLIGKTLAIHIQRTGIIKPTGSGNFGGSMLGVPETSLQVTEMLGLKLFVYLRAKIGGKVEIRELIDGKIAAVISQTEYDKRKLAEPKVYSDAFCGSMPVIPGIYQIHALLDDPNTDSEGNGAITLSEVHCDGDSLYPA